MPFRLIDKYFTGVKPKESQNDTKCNSVEKNVKYIDKKDNDKEKTATNFYLQCGDALVPIEVKFFPDKTTGKDNQYLGRKSVLSAFSEWLPDKA